jgi:hypothetical protein
MHPVPGTGTPPLVLIRDLVLFFIKLTLDGMKDVMLMWLSVMAVIGDLIIGGSRRGRLFYAVMQLGERIDLWLNVYGPARRAALNPDGLFGESRAGEDSYMGKMEELMGSERPVRPRVPLR